jgi:hypothetical protein
MKKRPDLTRVKMSKLMTSILKQRYSHKKQIKIDYETQFPTDLMLNDKIEKKYKFKKFVKVKKKIEIKK